MKPPCAPADLRRFLDGRPILARGISNVELAWRWCRRNRFVAGMTAITAAAILVLAIGATVVAFTFRGHRDQIEGAVRKTQEAFSSPCSPRHRPGDSADA